MKIYYETQNKFFKRPLFLGKRDRYQQNVDIVEGHQAAPDFDRGFGRDYAYGCVHCF